MRKLFTILTDSFLIWSRNFTLIYVFFLALLLLGMILPQNEAPAFELRWYLLFGIVLLLSAALMAGWFNMLAVACDRFLGRPSSSPLQTMAPLEALSLFKEFLPGISRWFLPITGGFCLQLAMLAFVLWPLQSLFSKYGHILMQLAQLPSASLSQQSFYKLPEWQQNEISSAGFLLLIGLLIYALLSFMASLWPAFVVYYDNNPLKAYFRSIFQIFKDPLGLIGLYALIFLLRLPMAVLYAFAGASNNDLLIAGSRMLHLTMEIFILVLMFVYVYRTCGKPTPQVEVPTPIEKLAGQDKDDPAS